MRMLWAARKLGLTTAMVAGLLAAIGCSPQGSQAPYQAFFGTVKALDVESGEFFVRSQRGPKGWRTDRNIPCIVTKDSEVYINDRFSDFGQLTVGDTVELFGYDDADRRFLVRFVHVTRSEPEPPLPVFSPPTTQPIPKPPEE